MDRINMICTLQGQATALQLDKKVMPGEAGPCFMITENGSFKGYITRQKDGCYRPIGTPYYTGQDLQAIGVALEREA